MSSEKSGTKAGREERKLRVLKAVAFSIAEAAPALGKSDQALRRLIQRHAVLEHGELVARLGGGVVARKKVGFAHWMVFFNAEVC